MPRRRNSFRLKGKSLLSRINGMSLPFTGGGLNWRPPVDEREIAKNLLTYLEDRRALYNPYALEIIDHVIQSIIEIRERLTSDLGVVSRTSVLGESLMSMRAACRKFLDDVQQQNHRVFYDAMLLLGELRARFGIHVARIAYIYDLEIEPQLASILPPEVEAD